MNIQMQKYIFKGYVIILYPWHMVKSTEYISPIHK